MSEPHIDTMTTPQLWPIFICYRRVDGSAAARRLHEILDKWQAVDSDGLPIQLDVYLDETMPGVADWKAVHRPYLEKARALIVVCTPGAKLNEGPEDWVHQEIDWWMAHREVAPILVDPLMEGLRYVPAQIAARWPDIQRIPLVEQEWSHLSGMALEQKTAAIRRQILGALLPSGAAIYAQEIAAERRRAQRLKRALTVTIALLFAIAGLGAYAYDRQRAAERSERIASASLLDTRAAASFNESRLIEARRELEISTRADIVARMDTAEPGGVREGNLRHELAQLDAEVAALKAGSRQSLAIGRELLQRADASWKALAAEGVAGDERRRPEPPYVFSVELINAGYGESILLHYGTPDDVKVIMINAGPRRTYKRIVEPRLRQLSMARFDSKPVPIELLVVSDRDEEKTGGLERLLSDIAKSPSPNRNGLLVLRGIWANIFRVNGGRGLRPRIRRLIDDLRIPLNEPFDRHVVRPDRGRLVVTLPGGLEVIVIGPAEKHIAALHELSGREAEERQGIIEPLLPETFKNVTIDLKSAPLAVAGNDARLHAPCVPSTNARRLAGGSYADKSVANLASIILLFRFMEQTFLYTGDARGDLIVEGLEHAGLLDKNGRAAVDLMTIPHFGSDRNITIDFFRRVRASGYLFSGDGRHNNPEITTVATLVAARECDAYRMYFVNRDGTADSSSLDLATGDEMPAAELAGAADANGEDSHGARLDAFFREEQRFNPRYRRVFRSLSGGSVIIDLLNPVRY